MPRKQEKGPWTRKLEESDIYVTFISPNGLRKIYFS